VNPEPAGRLYTLFSAAQEMDPAQRQPFLDRECAGQPELKARLLKMLEYSDRSGSPGNEPSGKLAPRIEKRPGNITFAHVFQADQIVSSRYCITRFINIGGMGEVYEAHDQELDCRVALKTIRPELADDEQTLARFKREIQLQREVVHENVCVLYDFGRHEEPDGETVNYLSMQYLAGETLSQKLKRDGKFSPAEALPLAMQIAAGLDAAHRAQILHRDLKSANVMLAPGAGDRLRAVVTDFGLARRITPPDREHTLTKPGDAMGTLDYMAPELLAGGSATVESDVYAFGVILHELVCGQRPYAADPANVAALKRIQGAPPLREKLPGLDRRWQRVIGRCLQTDPARRPSLAEIVGTLSGSATPRSLTAFGSLGLPRTDRSKRKRNFLVVAALLLLALSAIVVRHYWQTAQIHPGSAVYVMELTNATQDAELDSANDLLRNQLRQSAYFRMVDDAKVARARDLIASGYKGRSATQIGREIALRTGAALVVFSTLSGAADSYNLLVQIDRVGSDPFYVRKTWRQDFQATGKPQVFEAIRNAADYVRNVAGETSSEVAARDLAPQEAASNSWEALRLYRHAEDVRKKNQTEIALADLRRAVEIDPDFALAHLRLGDILYGLRREEESLEHFRVAINAAGRRRLSRWEELRLRGVYNLDIGEFSQAEGALAEWRDLYPYDYLPPHYLANALAEQGRLEEAVRMRLEAAEKAPDAYQPRVGLVGVYTLLGRLDEAEQTARQLQSVAGEALSLERQGLVRAVRGDMEGARVLFEKVLAGSDELRKSEAASLLGQLYAEGGQYDRALATYAEGISADLAQGFPEAAGQKHLASAALYARRNQRELARSHCLEAFRLARRLELYRHEGAILARLGYAVDTQGILDDVSSGWPGPLAEAARHHLRGEILLQQGAGAAALHELESADRLDSPLLPREYLAHAYEKVGDRGRALVFYESMVKSRAPYWQYADCELPAARASALLQIAILAPKSGQADRAASALREYISVRPTADASLPETQAVTQLLSGLPARKLN
jgi:tetratricopeptide (TPR) repeat protein/tRNA A-37 threonylcarbamoyl transferase component Bud32